MSGGHFEYKCFEISRFADELEHEIEVNDCDEMDQYGGDVGYHFKAETVGRLKRAHSIIALAGKLAREIEWLYSGDHGEESFAALYDRITEKEGL